MRLEEGKSYAWLFGVLAAAMLAGALLSTVLGSSMAWCLLILPAMATFLLVVQWRSGLALSRSWRADHRRGTPMFTFALLSNAAFVVFSLAVAVLAIVSMWARPK